MTQILFLVITILDALSLIYLRFVSRSCYVILTTMDLIVSGSNRYQSLTIDIIIIYLKLHVFQKKACTPKTKNQGGGYMLWPKELI